MAECTQLQNVSDKHVCPICQEKFAVPRSISDCKHTFCENCLFTFVFNLKEKGELGSTFECPVCRSPCKMNESGEVTMEWIQTFPLCTEMTSDDLDRSDGQPGNGKVKQICGSCSEEGKTATGKKHCLDCKGYLCEDCVTAHLKYKALKTHRVLDCDDNERPFEIFEEICKSYKCTKHPTFDFELYCNYHEELMCLMCATNSHKQCKDIIVLSDSSVLSEEEVGLTVRIEGAMKHLKSLRQISEDNCDVVKAHIKSYRNGLQQMKDEIIKRLNEIVDNEHALTKQIIIDVEDKKFINTQKVEHLIAHYENKMSLLHSVLENGKSKEVFIFLKSLALDINKLEEQIYQRKSELQVADVDLKLTDVMNSVLVKISEDQLPTSSARYQWPKHLPIIKVTDTEPFAIESVDVHSVKGADQKYAKYTNIIVQMDGLLIMCDNYCGFVVTYHPQHERKQTLKLQSPFYATQMSNATIAVTLPKEKSILILSDDITLKREKSVTTKQTPNGIVALNDGTVAISWEDPPAFSISDLSGPEIQNLVYFTEDNTGRKFKSFDYMTINVKRQYAIQSCKTDKAVYCFTFKQQPVFKYTNNLTLPRGVTLDPKTGSVFVCDFSDRCIHQVSISGEPISVIRHEMLGCPLSVCFDEQTKCLWVTRDNNPYDRVTCFKQVQNSSK